MSERDVSKYILMELTEEDVQDISKVHHLKTRSFAKNYFVARKDSGGIVIFQTTYGRTSHARPPDDGKLRQLNAEYSWATVAHQCIVPKPGVWDKAPLPCSIIYS